MPVSSIQPGGGVAAAGKSPSSSSSNSKTKNAVLHKKTNQPSSSTTAAAFPLLSSDSLPLLCGDERTMEGRNFAVNEECTSLKFSPSGRLVVAGFADGTVRLFDLTGTYDIAATTSTSASTSTSKNATSNSNNNSKSDNGGSADSDSSSENEAFAASNDNDNSNNSGTTTEKRSAPAVLGVRRHRTGRLVLSKEHQQYGAVASQIRAKGVHTALRMDVDVAPDCQWCFAGVLRGSMELVAVHLGAVEESMTQKEAGHETNNGEGGNDRNLLDLVTVHRHSDAKLRGFGACARLRSGERYLLLTGKAIKNIHIWSFTPPQASSGTAAVWECLYDTATNGNTIKLLAFRHTATSSSSASSQQLQALSKSDNQKLRVWDLQHEEEREPEPNSSSSSNNNKARQRPNRPPFYDVANTESLLGIAGEFGVCGGDEFFNQMSIVRLDDDDDGLYNHTEIALFGDAAAAAATDWQPGRRSRRPQRGDLKCVASVAGGTAGHALLELSDGSVTHYQQQQQQQQPPSSGNLAADNSNNSNSASPSPLRTVLSPLPEGHCRHVAVGRMGRQGTVCAAAACYNPATGMGNIRFQVLEKECRSKNNNAGRPLFWGFLASQSASVAEAPSAKVAAGTDRPPVPSSATATAPAARSSDARKTPGTAEAPAAAARKSMESSNGHKDRPIPSSSTASSAVCSSASRRTGTADSIATTATASTTNAQPATAAEKAKARLAKIVTTSKKQFVVGAENSINKTARKRKGGGGGADQSLVTPRTASTTTSTTASNGTGSRTNALPSAPSSTNTVLARRLSTPFINAATADEGEKPRLSVDSTKNHLKDLNNAATTANVAAQTTTTSTFIPDSRKRKKERNSETSMSSLEQEQQRKKRQPTAKANSNIAASNASKPNLATLRESMQSPFPMASNDNDDGSVFTLSSPSTFRTPRSPVPSSSRRDPAATRELILEVCREKLALVESLLQEHSSAPSVWERRAALSKLQEDGSGNPAAVARCKLSLEHREAHRRLRQQILGTVQSTIRSIQEAPSYSSLEKARGFLQAALDAYTQQVDAMIYRQWNETTTLVATTATTSTTHKEDASDAQPQMVPFAFPSVFAQARQCFPEIVYSLQ